MESVIDYPFVSLSDGASIGPLTLICQFIGNLFFSRVGNIRDYNVSGFVMGAAFMTVFCCCMTSAVAASSNPDSYDTSYQHVVALDRTGTKFAFWPKVPGAQPDISALNRSMLRQQENSENNLDPFRIFPEFVGNIHPERGMQWKGDCFKKNTIKFTKFDQSGAIIEIHLDAPRTLFCTEEVLFLSTQGFYVHPFISRGDHSLTIAKWRNDMEYQDVKENGLRLFTFKPSALPLILDTLEFAAMFTGPWAAKETMTFFHNYMGLDLPKRTQPGVYYLDESLIHSGDLLVMLEFNGLHGLICFGTGSHVGHIATALWMEGKLYVVEITMNSDPARSGVIRTPYREFLQRKQKDGAMVRLIPLHPSVRAKFNESAAIQYFYETKGWPYGLHNFVFGWIDTVDASLPPPLTWENLAFFLLLADSVAPQVIFPMFGEGLVHRLREYYDIHTNVSNMRDLLGLLGAKNISLPELFITPEKDEWIFSDGHPSMVCSVYVLTMWRRAGLFDSLPFAATELSPRDIYSLRLFDTEWKDQPKQCLQDGDTPGAKSCQLTGNYVVTLPGLNEITPFPHMFERCGSAPKEYVRVPQHC